MVHESPSTAVVDGDGAIGMIAATKSMQIAIEKAKTAGTGWVSTRGSNHYGIAGYYSMMALEHDMIGIMHDHCQSPGCPHFFSIPDAGNQSHCCSSSCRNSSPFCS